MQRASRTVFVISLGLLLLFAAVGVQLYRHTVPCEALASLSIEPSADGVIIGHRELAQHPGPRSADNRHLLVRRLENQWQLFNISWSKKVDASTTRLSTRYLKRWKLKRGDVIRIDGVSLHVTHVDAHGLTLHEPAANRRVEWADGRLIPRSAEEEFVFQACLSWRQRAGRSLRWRMRHYAAAKEIFLFSLGGGVNCPDRWRIPGIAPKAARVLWYDNAFWLAPGAVETDLYFSRKNGALKSFTEMALPVSGDSGRVKRLILGRTYYTVSEDNNRLILTPVYGNDVWFEKHGFTVAATPGTGQNFKKMTWVGSGAPLADLLQDRQWMVALILLVSLAGSLLIWHRYKHLPGSRRYSGKNLLFRATAVFPSILLGLLTLFVWRSSGGVDMMVMLILVWFSWLWATLILAAKSRLRGTGGWLWTCALFMAGAGTIVLTQLAAGAVNTRWLVFAQKHILILTAFAWFVAIMAMVPLDRLGNIWQDFVTAENLFWKVVHRVLLGVTLLVLGALPIFGGEGGVWGIQPAETAKLLLIFMGGFVGMHLLELRRKDSGDYRQRARHYIWNFIKIFLFVGLAVIIILKSVNDISPALIIFVLALAWIWVVAPHPWKKTKAAWIWRGLIALVALTVVVLGAWMRTNPEQVPGWVPQRERFLVWAQPQMYPHSGEQVSRAMLLVGRGGYLGAQNSWFGPNGDANRLPAVQNDFILSFFLHRFGGVCGLTLALAQIIFLGCFFQLSRRCLLSAAAMGNYKIRQSRSTLGLVVHGFAWICLTQWAISWGNTLGLLPVMGQPMTWMSSANSHMVFIGLPALAIAMLANWIVEPR